jgi:hypothetical protein
MLHSGQSGCYGSAENDAENDNVEVLAVNMGPRRAIEQARLAKSVSSSRSCQKRRCCADSTTDNRRA